MEFIQINSQVYKLIQLKQTQNTYITLSLTRLLNKLHTQHQSKNITTNSIIQYMGYKFTPTLTKKGYKHYHRNKHIWTCGELMKTQIYKYIKKLISTLKQKHTNFKQRLFINKLLLQPMRLRPIQMQSQFNRKLFRLDVDRLISHQVGLSQDTKLRVRAMQLLHSQLLSSAQESLYSRLIQRVQRRGNNIQRVSDDDDLRQPRARRMEFQSDQNVGVVGDGNGRIINVDDEPMEDDDDNQFFQDQGENQGRGNNVNVNDEDEFNPFDSDSSSDSDDNNINTNTNNNGRTNTRLNITNNNTTINDTTHIVIPRNGLNTNNIFRQLRPRRNQQIQEVFFNQRQQQQQQRLNNNNNRIDNPFIRRRGAVQRLRLRQRQQQRQQHVVVQNNSFLPYMNNPFMLTRNRQVHVLQQLFQQQQQGIQDVSVQQQQQQQQQRIRHNPFMRALYDNPNPRRNPIIHSLFHTDVEERQQQQQGGGNVMQILPQQHQQQAMGAQMRINNNHSDQRQLFMIAQQNQQQQQERHSHQQQQQHVLITPRQQFIYQPRNQWSPYSLSNQQEIQQIDQDSNIEQPEQGGVVEQQQQQSQQ